MILLHDARDEHAVWVHILAALEFVFPQLERSVADELDVFPADDFAARRKQLAITRRDVDNFARVKRNRFGDDRAPTFFESARNDVEICSWRT